MASILQHKPLIHFDNLSNLFMISFFFFFPPYMTDHLVTCFDQKPERYVLYLVWVAWFPSLGLGKKEEKTYQCKGLTDGYSFLTNYLFEFSNIQLLLMTFSLKLQESIYQRE